MPTTVPAVAVGLVVMRVAGMFDMTRAPNAHFAQWQRLCCSAA